MRKSLSIIVGLGLLLLHCETDEKKIQQRYLNLLQHQEIKEMPGLQSINKVLSFNFNLRNPSYVILHHTALTRCIDAIQHLSNPASQVSAHYLICKDGSIFQLIEDHARAWHTGSGKWGNINDMNSVSLGIELDNFGFEPFPEVQIESLIVLLKFLKEKYKIPPTNILGHGDIAPARKEDPHCLFPWQRLANEGLAVMPSKVLTENVPDYFDPILALRYIGYDISKPEETFQAFRRRFVGCVEQDDRPLSPQETSILYNIFVKYYSWSIE